MFLCLNCVKLPAGVNEEVSKTTRVAGGWSMRTPVHGGDNQTRGPQNTWDGLSPDSWSFSSWWCECGPHADRESSHVALIAQGVNGVGRAGNSLCSVAAVSTLSGGAVAVVCYLLVPLGNGCDASPPPLAPWQCVYATSLNSMLFACDNIEEYDPLGKTSCSHTMDLVCQMEIGVLNNGVCVASESGGIHKVWTLQAFFPTGASPCPQGGPG